MATTHEQRSLWGPVIDSIQPGGTTTIKTLTGGTNSNVYLLNISPAHGKTTKTVVRVSAEPNNYQQLGGLLDTLDDTGVPVPHVKWYGWLNGQEAVALSYIEGTTTPQENWQTEAQERAKTLALIHSSPIPDNLTLPAWSTEINPELQKWWASHPKAAQTLQTLANSQPAAYKPVLLHGDYWAGNILWDNNQITGIIDWDRVGIGPRDIDLAKSSLDLALIHGLDAAKAFADHYQQDTGHKPDSWWTLLGACHGMPNVSKWWAPSYKQHGIHLTPKVLEERYEEYLQHCAQQHAGRPTP